MESRLGDAMGGGMVQAMVPRGVETIVGLVHDASFGSIVMFGLGGTTAELLGDRAVRILPLTVVDAHDLVRSLRGSPLLFGYRGAPPAAVDRVEDMLLRVGLMADELPEIAELDLNPVVVSEHGAVAVDVKIRLAPVPTPLPADLRRMRDSKGAGRSA
jgi:acyl-CoA synthetase (NDP forming)